jgi:ATP-binding cassette subfamily F protein 3
VEPFEGDLDEYATWLSTRANKSATGSAEPAQSARPKPELARTKGKPKAKPDPQGGQRQLLTLEERLQALATELATLERQLAEPEVYAAQPDQLTKLTRRHTVVREAHEGLEAEWLALYGQLEAG